MYYPKVGDIASYNNGVHAQTYLVLAVRPVEQELDYLAIADVLCLNNGKYFEEYPWPKHTWEKLA